MRLSPRLLLSVSLVLPLFSPAAEEKPAPPIAFSDIPSPVNRRPVGISVTTAPDGAAWLSWIESDEHANYALKFSTFNLAANQWSSPGSIVRGVPFLAFEWPEYFPTLAVGENGRATAVWFVGHAAHNVERAAFVSQTLDGGKKWDNARPLTREETTSIEFAALVTLADGRVLAAWIDGRDFEKREKRVMQLFARVLGESGPDLLIDPSMPRFSRLSLSAFPDGGALLAYHGLNDDQRITVRTARFKGRAWDESRTLDPDVGRATGPRLASDGGRVAAAWFTAADNAPRVLASFSPDAGTRFLLRLRMDRGKPVGHVDTLILRDGAMLVTWLETDGSLWLRRITPDFTADEPIALAPAGTLSVKTNPRLALLRDYAGGTEPVQLLATFATDTALRTLLVTVP